MLNGVDLFSGIGGISLALRDYVRPIAYCEIDPYCQAVLLSRMVSGDLPEAPIWDDIKTLCLRSYDATIDILYGGFPCQDISVAGTGKGLEGERSGLFFEIVRLCREIQPQFIFLENVPAITTRGGSRVVGEITALGYDCRWCVISAASVGALHKRERWFLLAHANNNGSFASKRRGSTREDSASREQHEQTEVNRQAVRASELSSDVANANGMRKLQSEGQQQDERRWSGNSGENVSNSKSKGLEGQRQSTERNDEKQPFPSSSCYPFGSIKNWQETVQSMGKCSDGLSNQVARLRALGNSVVPAQAKEAFEILMGIK